MRVALVYDRVNKLGGAERVLLALKKIFPQAVLFTSVYSKKRAKWARAFSVQTSFLQKFSFAVTHHELFPVLMPIAFESFSFKNFDLVISITSEAAKGIITNANQKHLCICLTPTRYLWSGYSEYFKNRLFSLFSKPLVWYLREWDKAASLRPDVYIAISHEVQKRIKKFYSRKSHIIYPPYSLLPGRVKPTKGSYFLVVSRLSKFTQYKRVDLAIKACNVLRLPLVIVGGGDISYFKKIAGPTITFAGNVSDKLLRSYYQNCKALLFPGLEDFGLVMVEAQSFGKPVIAYKAGGALEIIKEGKTGMFFTRQTVESLAKALKKFNERSYNTVACQKNAKRFSFEIFKREIKNTVRHSMEL